MRVVACLLAVLPTVFVEASARSLDIEDQCIVLASLNSSVGAFGQIAHLLDVTDERPVRLVTRLEEIDTGRIATEMLGDYGFRPDRANVALVEYLNPDLSDINRLAIGDKILVPMLEAYDGQAWQSFIPEVPIDGFAVAERVAEQVADIARVQAYETNEQVLHLASRWDDPALLGEAAPLGAQLIEAAESLTDWRDYGEFLGDHSQRIAHIGIASIAVEQMAEAAREQPSTEMAFIPRLQFGDGWQATPEKIALTLNIFDRARRPLHDHQVYFMSKGMKENECDQRHALPFSSLSHAAFHRMDRAEFVFWAVNPDTRDWSKPFELNLRDFESPHMMSIYVEW